MFEFKKAVKGVSLARIAMIAPPGGGKTYTALKFASVLAGKKRVRLIDTEQRTALKYANLFDFDHAELGPPYTARRYTEAIRAMNADGQLGCAIVDSQSHAWNAEGGILDQVDAKGGGFEKWRDVKPEERALIDSWYKCPAHLIVTFRTATEYLVAQKENKHGKMVAQPTKVGLKPVFKDGMEYELDLVCYFDEDATMRVTKSRIPDLAGLSIAKPGAEWAEKILAWCEDGVVKAPARLGDCADAIQLQAWCKENAKRIASSTKETQADLRERIELKAEGFGIPLAEAIGWAGLAPPKAAPTE